MFKSNPVKAFEKDFLDTNEKLLKTVYCQSKTPYKDNDPSGALLITTNRVVFYKRGIISEEYEEVYFDELESVRSFNLKNKLHLVVATERFEYTYYTAERVDMQSALAVINKRMISSPSIDNTADSDNSTETFAECIQKDIQSNIDKLKRLNQLHTSGILDESCYVEKRTELVSSIKSPASV